MLFPFEKIRVKPGTVLIETVLSGDPLYWKVTRMHFKCEKHDICQTNDHKLLVDSTWKSRLAKVTPVWICCSYTLTWVCPLEKKLPGIMFFTNIFFLLILASDLILPNLTWNDSSLQRSGDFLAYTLDCAKLNWHFLAYHTRVFTQFETVACTF